MAEQTTKTIKTKILLRYDVLKNWTEANPELKKGEVAIVAIPTENEALNVNGTTPPQILFKVGDGTSKFNDLPYASGKAADVYSWAKEASISIAKDGTGNVVSGIEWDATANGGKGGIKFTTASVATSEGFKQVQDRLAKLEAEIGDAANDYATSRIDSLEKTIRDNSETWAKDDNTTYTFEKLTKGFKVTPSAGTAQEFTFDYLTSDEIKDKIEAYGYKNETDIKAIVESYKYTTIESLNNYYTKGEIDAKGFLTEHQSLANYYNKTEVDGLVSPKADKSYVDEELGKKANTTYVNDELAKKVDLSVYNERVTAVNNRFGGIDEKISGIEGGIEDINTELGNIDTDLGEINDALALKADASALNSYELKADADLVRGRVNTLEGHFAEGGRVTEAESKISTLETTVGNLSGAFQFQGTRETVEELPKAIPANKGHVYLVDDLEYASNGTSWIQLGQNGDFVLDSIYQAHLTAQAAVDKGQSDKIAAIEKDIADNREGWASKTSVTDPTAGDGKITVNGVEMVVYTLPEDVVKDPNYKHITVTETSVSDGTTTFNKYDDAALAGRVTTVEGKVKTLEETTVPALDNRIKEVEKIKVTSTSVTDGTNTFTKYDDTALAGRVSEIEKDYLTSADEKALSDAIKAEKDRVDGLVNTTVPGITGRLDALEAKPDITITETSVSDGTNTFTKYDDKALSDRVKVVEDNFADWAIIWDCGGASNN